MAAAIRAHTNLSIQVRIQKRALRKEQARFSLVQNITSYNRAKRNGFKFEVQLNIHSQELLLPFLLTRGFSRC